MRTRGLHRDTASHGGAETYSHRATTSTTVSTSMTSSSTSSTSKEAKQRKALGLSLLVDQGPAVTHLGVAPLCQQRRGRGNPTFRQVKRGLRDKVEVLPQVRGLPHLRLGGGLDGHLIRKRGDSHSSRRTRICSSAPVSITSGGLRHELTNPTKDLFQSQRARLRESWEPNFRCHFR